MTRTPSGSTATRRPGAGPSAEDRRLVAALRAGDQAAFAAVLDQYSPGMLHLAQCYVAEAGAAEDLVQETWIAVLRRLPRFTGRRALKIWIFRILLHRARRRGPGPTPGRPFAACVAAELQAPDPAVEPTRFRPVGEQWAGGWASFPPEWDAVPAERRRASEIGALLQAALAGLPLAQQTILRLRDLAGWNAAEVGALLAITADDQRVLLHRARAKLRRALAHYLTGE